MATTLRIDVKPDFLVKLAAGKPTSGLEELVWNALDADATKVDVVVSPSMMGHVAEIAVEDNGTGISPLRTPEVFGNLGGSWKRKKSRTAAGRIMHGSQGRGRFRAFTLGNLVTWDSVSDGLGGDKLRCRISAARDNLSSFEVEELQEAPNAPVGTRVTIKEVIPGIAALRDEILVPELTSEFALYLRQYPNITISVNGHRLDAQAAISRTFEFPLKPESSTLVVVEWVIPVDRALYLCDEQGATLARVPPGIQAPGFNFTAYVKSPTIRAASDNGTLEFESFNEGLKLLVDEAKNELRRYFRERAAADAAAVVDRWKESKVYPYPDAPRNPVEQVEQQVFDAVAININSYLPSFEDSDDDSKKFTFRLIRQAIESDTDALQTILRDVIKLPPDKQEELADLLRQTTLSAIISASKVVGDRLNFIAGLEALVFDADLRPVVKERSQLHRLVAPHAWLFGEEYNLSVDDQGLTEVLRQHCESLGIEVLDDSPVLREDGSKGVVDLMLSRVIPLPNPDVREHLVIELKRPKVHVDQKAIAQVESYAFAVANDPRFINTQTTWNFWALSTELDPLIAAKASQKDRPRGLISEFDGGRIRVWAKAWSEVVRSAKGRLDFFQKHLAFRADRASGLNHLRHTLGEHLPTEAHESSV